MIEDREGGRDGHGWVRGQSVAAVAVHHVDGDAADGSRTGRIDFTHHLGHDLEPGPVDAWYLCGPEELVATTTELLEQKHDIPVERIHTELFTSTVAPRPAMKPGLPSTVGLTHAGRTITFTLPRNTDTLLDAGLQYSEDLPYSCLSGSCGTCRIKITRGRVETEDNTHAPQTPAEIESGYTLTCLARPFSNDVTATFD